MKKYFTRGLIATFILATVFSVSALLPTKQVSAQSTTSVSVCQLIDLLLSANIISADQAAALKPAVGCSASTGSTQTTTTTDGGVPNITFGVTPALACGTTKVNLMWANAIPGATTYDGYLDDTINPAPTVDTCAHPLAGDACGLGMPITQISSAIIDVQAGHTYNYVVKANDQIKSMSFVVPQACPVTQTTAPASTVTLKISTTTVNGLYVDGSVTAATGTSAWLSWMSTNASTCSASASPATSTWSGAVATSSASTTIGKIDATRTYTINCTGINGGANSSDSVAVTVPSNNVVIVNPVITSFKIATTSISGPYFSDSAIIATGTPAWLKWVTTNATACSASAMPALSTWSGAVATTSAGTSVGSIDKARTYQISCSNGITGSSRPVANLDVTVPTAVNNVVTCTSYATSTWSACTSAGTQTRTVTGSPAGCVAGTVAIPASSQVCTYVPPVTPAPTINVSIKPGTFIVSWSTTNAVSCKVSVNRGAATPIATSGTIDMGGLASTMNVVMWCTGPTGSITAYPFTLSPQ